MAVRAALVDFGYVGLAGAGALLMSTAENYYV